MKTGLESLDVGASDITYSGNEGPKSPQEDQKMMKEFQIQQMAGGENDRVRELLLKEETQGLSEDEKEELRQLIKTISAQMPGGGIGDMAMADPLLEDEYEKYVFEMEEQGLQPMSIEEFEAEARAGMNEGGIMDSKYNIENRRQYFSGAYGQGAGDRGGDPRGSREENVAAGRTDAGNIQKAMSVPKGIEITKDDFEKFVKKKKITDRFPYSSAIKKLGPLAYLPGRKEKAIKNKRDFMQLKGIPSDAFTDEELNTTDAMNFLDQFGYGDFLKGIGLPGLSVSGNMSQVGEKFVVRDPITNEAIKDQFDNITYKYSPIKFGEGQAPDQQILPMTTGMENDVDETAIASAIPYRGNQFLRADNQALAADGGRIGYAGGGITDLRQGYFLGKLVKKATRGIKKIIKSPIGKAALLAGGFGLAGMGPFQGLQGSPFAKFLLGSKGIPGFPAGREQRTLGLFGRMLDSKIGTSLKNKLLMESLGDGEYGGIDPFKVGILGASALTGLMAKRDQDNEQSLDEYLGSASRGPGIDPRGIREMIAANKGNINPMDFAFLNPDYYQTAADGGRMGLAGGGIGKLRGALSKEMFGYDDDEDDVKKLAMGGSTGLPPVTMMSEGTDSMSFPDDESTGMTQATTTLPNQMPRPRPMMDPRMMQQMMIAQKMNPQMMSGRMMAAMGGRMGFAEGGDEGELLDMGGMEKDYRNEGGFVPMGEYERKDDVPARLSKNEFVFTADAVRNAGGGDIDKGAEIMENMMENLEAGGKVSKGSQGLSGAREMFATQQRLGEVL